MRRSRTARLAMGGVLVGALLAGLGSTQATAAPAPDPVWRAATAAPFTVVVLPDTQFYTRDYPATYRAQTQWVVNNRNALNVVFVAHEGDIVQGVGKHPHWIVADSAHDTLDAAGIPYAVVPGNHDQTRTGVAKLYDSYFPPSRFKNDPWYLGYLGDSKSGSAQGTGQDNVSDAGVDRLNKDSYQLVQASGVRLVFINLEMDMPAYSVAWAQRVIDAQMAVNSNTEFVLVTHTFLTSKGVRANTPWWRADGTSAEKVWQTLVRPNCNVHLVLSGHYSAEKQRTDNNACGEPVHQVLADYQKRPHGGDGWLRYLTFQPSANKIDVFTYSPTLGKFETDSNSRFSLTLAMP